MRIAQIAPLEESVPPKLYGGTERVVSYLTEELVRLGHRVTLFASGDSETAAELVAAAPGAPLALMLEQVRARAHEFDVMHFHVEHVHLPLFRPLAHKTLTTLHGRLDPPEPAPLYREFAAMPLVSISDSQRAPLGFAHWAGTVYHGLPSEVCPFNPAPRGDYFAFLGRVSPESGLERALDIAQRAGVRLRIAAKIDAADEAYFHERIEPRLGEPGIDFVGEVDETGKPAFLGNATALLFPIEWPEPFGLAMIEALSCGTPVMAWAQGAAAEVIEHGLTGFHVQSVDAAVDTLERAARLDRSRVRRRFEERFSATRMAQDYLALYRALARKRALAAA